MNNTLPNASLESVREAARRIAGYVEYTPLEKNVMLSEQYGATVLFKLETAQIIKAYKIRGALNSMLKKREEGQQFDRVVCASAGNHAQGVALGCKLLEIHGDIFMPARPFGVKDVKKEKVQEFGGEYVTVHVVGKQFDEAQEAAHIFCNEEGAVFIHPFDDVDVICGQATIALEIIDQLKEQSINSIDFLIVPVGGGGLLSGLEVVFKELMPTTKIIGVEPLGAPSMTAALFNKAPKSVRVVDKFVDGAAVATVGKLNYEICKERFWSRGGRSPFDNQVDRLTNRVEVVSEGYVALMKRQLLNDPIKPITVEPAGALSVAGLDLLKYEIAGKTVVCLISGANDISTESDKKIADYLSLEQEWSLKPRQNKLLGSVVSMLERAEADIKHITQDEANSSWNIRFVAKNQGDATFLFIEITRKGFEVHTIRKRPE